MTACRLHCGPTRQQWAAKKGPGRFASRLNNGNHLTSDRINTGKKPEPRADSLMNSPSSRSASLPIAGETVQEVRRASLRKSYFVEGDRKRHLGGPKLWNSRVDAATGVACRTSISALLAGQHDVREMTKIPG